MLRRKYLIQLHVPTNQSYEINESVIFQSYHPTWYNSLRLALVSFHLATNFFLSNQLCNYDFLLLPLLITWHLVYSDTFSFWEAQHNPLGLDYWSWYSINIVNQTSLMESPLLTNELNNFFIKKKVKALNFLNVIEDYFHNNNQPN